jgi:hypothetical protein
VDVGFSSEAVYECLHIILGAAVNKKIFLYEDKFHACSILSDSVSSEVYKILRGIVCVIIIKLKMICSARQFVRAAGKGN